MTQILNVGPDGKALIQHFEGCKLKAYPDPGTGGAPWTIGWGTTGPDIHQGLIWTQAQADARFEADLARFVKSLSALIQHPATTQHQFDALTCFAYNVGLTNLRGSTLRQRHEAGDFSEAKAEFAKWDKAAGHVIAGLTTRRLAEAELYGRGK